MRALILLSLLSLLLTCPARAAGAKSTHVYLVEGSNVAARVQDRLFELLQKVAGIQLTEVSDAAALKPEAGSVVLSIGDTPFTRSLISEADLSAQGPEGFLVRSGRDNGALVIATTGNAAQGERTSMTGHRGVSYGAYEVLQQIGFRFLHPYTPSIPKNLVLPAVTTTINVVEKPRWPTRAIHWHTMHPIELAHVLNGWGPAGPQDAQGFNSLLPEWDLFLEWMIAHRQNAIEWVLLADKTHISFNDSPERIARLQRLVQMSHAWGLLTGIDVGVVFEQQNMWRLLRTPGTDQADSLEIRGRIAWLMKADWDFMTAEMGASEFTAPGDLKMLYWMNILTDEMERVFNRFAAVKVHCSEGQIAKNFKDPDTGAALNFNFLPHFADKKLMVLPHTVELYSLDDPAPTYGQTDFKEIHRFLSMQAGARNVLFYPESTYYISYDIDVPLFLPAYADRRLHDLRLIAHDEDARLLGRGAQRGSHIQGQMLFASGLEWGYWFNNLVAMHAAWDPRPRERDEAKAFEQITLEILRPDPASKTTSTDLISLLNETIKAQNEILIQGVVNGKAPRQIERLTGIAYLAGQETWDELNTSLSDVLKIKRAPTQPNRLGFRSLRAGLVGQGVDFVADVHPLLDGMEVSFGALSAKMIDLFRRTPLADTNRDVLAEFADGALMNTLRATQIHALYDSSASGNLQEPAGWGDQKLARARKALDLATAVVARRETHYRTHENLTAWGPNQTVYNYGYLWTVHSLFYLYRDEGNVSQQPANACYMNIVNPANTVLADGQDNTYYQWAKSIARAIGLGSIDECLDPSMNEPNPRARVRASPARP